MHEEAIAQPVIKKIEELIRQAFAQLEGKNSDVYTKLYLTMDESKEQIRKRSGLSEETINQISALIGEKAAAEIGITLLQNTVGIKETNITSSKQNSNYRKEEAQKILREQLFLIITNKMNSKCIKNYHLTIAELKLAKIISANILNTILTNKEITLQTKVSLEQIQNIIHNSATEIIKLIYNNGKAPAQATKIPEGNKSILASLNSTLNIMNIATHKGIGNNGITAPDPTPATSKVNQRGR